MTLYETALSWLNNGYVTIPVGYYSKKPTIEWEPYQTQLPSKFELLQWFPSEMRNIGLVVGNGLVVIDFDVQDVFNYWYSLYPLTTYMVKTRRGVHVYIKTTEPAHNRHSDLLDIKAERGYVLIPPSIHPSGYQYQVLQDVPILTVNALEDILPEYFIPEPAPIDTEPLPVLVNLDPWDLADHAVSIEMGSIQKIRQTVSLLSILRGAEVSSRDGRWYKALCPFHADRAPSFWIDLKRGMCGCRKCNIKEMDVINLYARMHRISNDEAIRVLITMV